MSKIPDLDWQPFDRRFRWSESMSKKSSTFRTASEKIERLKIVMRVFADVPEESITEHGKATKELALIVLELLED